MATRRRGNIGSQSSRPDCPFLLTLIASGTAIWLIGDLGTSINQLANVSAEKPFQPAQTDGNESYIVAEERGILLRAIEREPALIAHYNQDFAVTATLMKDHCCAFNALAQSAEEKSLVDPQ